MHKCNLCSSKRVKYFTKIKNYKFFRCGKCNTLQLKYSKFKPTYSAKFKYLIDRLSKRRIIKNSKDILYYIKKKNYRGNTLLDIGSGFGYFLNEASKAYKYTLGLEPSQNLYKFSSKKLKVNVLNKSFQNYLKNSKYQKFDVITMIHVIEHVKNPKKFIKKALTLLNNDGILFIETPNLDSWLFDVEQKKYTFLTPPEHTYILSLDSFKEILKTDLNSKITKIVTYSYTEHAVKIIKELFTLNISKNTEIERKPVAVFIDDRPAKRLVNEIKKSIFYIIFHKILGPIILPFLKLYYKGTFLRLYIKKIA